MKTPTFISRFSFIALSLALAFSLALGLAQVGSASGWEQGVAPTPTPTQGPKLTPTPSSPAAGAGAAAGKDEVLFSALGLTDQLMTGPYDSFSLRFSVPVNWKFSAPVTVNLNLAATAYDMRVGQNASPMAAAGGTLDIFYNSEWIMTQVIDWKGDRTVLVSIPTAALQAGRADGRHDLTMYFTAPQDCAYDHETTLVVKATSGLVLPHDIVQLQADLRQFPRPLLQDNPIVANEGLIVVPDQPSAAELRAALNLSAGLARLTMGRMPTTLVTQSQATPEWLNSRHVILVGKPGGLPLLTSAPVAALPLPVPVEGAGFKLAGLQAEDGLVQMEASPWNPGRLLLVVSGVNDAGVVKAAQALTSGALLVGASPKWSMVQEIRPPSTPVAGAEDRTLAKLGYAAVTLSGMGIHTQDYTFIMPPGMETNADAYFNLVFTHSALIDETRSGLIVRLNDQLIGSARLSKNATGQTEVKIRVPSYLILPGSNILTVEADLMPVTLCTDANFTNLWLLVSPESLLHLPQNLSQAGGALSLNLNQYPLPFTQSANLSKLAFLLPSNDPASWAQAALITGAIGRKTSGTLIQFETAFDGQVPAELRQDTDWIVIGQAKNLPSLAEWGEALPAPFAAGSVYATDRSSQVGYRLPEGISIGYLELLTAPWNPARALLLVVGSDPTGVQYAAAALTTSKLTSLLAGNFATISGEQVVSSDTRIQSAAVAPPASATPAPVQPTPGAAPADAVGRTWIPYALAAILILMAIVLAVAFFTRHRSG